MSLVERIQDLCGRENTTLIGLERAIGLGRGTIRNWDKSSPSIDKVQKVADYFGVSTDFLQFGFEKARLVQMVGFAMAGNTTEEFAESSGIDVEYLTKLRNGDITERPTFEILSKINKNPNNILIGLSDLLDAAGYINREAALKEKYENKQCQTNDNEIEELLETLHKRPEMKTLFSISKNATKEDIEKTIKIIEALKDDK